MVSVCTAIFAKNEWGLARLSCDKLDEDSDDQKLDYKYTFHRTAGGGGMSTIYVLDTGVYVEHVSAV